ncbi:gp53-like domain-containing protein [Pseudescherichia vulneris]
MPRSAAICIFLKVGLGEAAKRDVGIGINQLPDMSSFANSLSINGYQKFPGGLILQWGSFNVLATTGPVGITDVTFPIAFPGAMRGLSAVMSTNDPSQRFTGFDIGSTTKTKTRFTYVTPTANSIYWVATGY